MSNATGCQKICCVILIQIRIIPWKKDTSLKCDVSFSIIPFSGDFNNFSVINNCTCLDIQNAATVLRLKYLFLCKLVNTHELIMCKLFLFSILFLIMGTHFLAVIYNWSSMMHAHYSTFHHMPCINPRIPHFSSSKWA